MDATSDPRDPGVDTPGGGDESHDPDGRSGPLLSRRRFGSVVFAAALAPALSGDLSGSPPRGGSRREASSRFQQSARVETDGWQVSRVRVEEQFRFVGASVRLYNPADHPRSVKVRYLLYREDGRQEYRAEEWVTVPGDEQRHAARWWKKDRPGTASPRIAFADVEIVESVDGVVDEDPVDGTTTTTSTTPTVNTSTSTTTSTTTTSTTTVPDPTTTAARPTTTPTPTETTGVTTTTTPGFGLLTTLGVLVTAGIARFAARRRRS